ncbi:MAG: hypothetical protein ACLGI2_09535 [Acidimicrobiia bacterium]
MSPPALGPRGVALACALALGLACGGNTPTEGEKAMEATASQLGTIRSGVLQFRLVAGPVGEEENPQAGFEMSGPFALPEPGALPVTQIDYTRIAGGDRTTTQLVSTGSRAFVVLDGTAYQLTFDQTERLRAPSQAGGDHGFGGLRIGEWVEEPQVSPGEVVADTATDRITATVDVVRALNDLLAFGRGLGAAELAVPEITGEDAEQLRHVTESATLELLTGKEDRRLRRLSVDIRLAGPVPARVRTALGPVAAAAIKVTLALEEPNTPVQVAAPEGALPASARPRPS